MLWNRICLWALALVTSQFARAIDLEQCQAVLKFPAQFAFLFVDYVHWEQLPPIDRVKVVQRGDLPHLKRYQLSFSTANGQARLELYYREDEHRALIADLHIDSSLPRLYMYRQMMAHLVDQLPLLRRVELSLRDSPIERELLLDLLYRGTPVDVHSRLPLLQVFGRLGFALVNRAGYDLTLDKVENLE